MPPPPSVRGGELATGGARTVYEFTGSEAERGGRSSTFIGGEVLDLGGSDPRTESNLRGGPGGWVFMGVAVVLIGGIVGYFTLMGGPSSAEATPAAVTAEPGEADTPSKPDPAPAEGEPSEQAGAADEDKKEQGENAAKDDDSAKADPAKDEPKPEPKADEPEKKKSSTTKSTGSKSSSKGTSKPSKPRPKKKKRRKSLSTSKPPRDPLKNLPTPPGE